MVETDGHRGHGLKLRASSLEELGVDLLSQHTQTGIASLDGSKELISGHSLIRIIPVDDLHRSVSQNLHGGGRNLSRNQNLLHHHQFEILTLGLAAEAKARTNLGASMAIRNIMHVLD